MQPQQTRSGVCSCFLYRCNEQRWHWCWLSWRGVGEEGQLSLRLVPHSVFLHGMSAAVRQPDWFSSGEACWPLTVWGEWGQIGAKSAGTGGFSEHDLRWNGNSLLAGGEGGSMTSPSWGPCCESHLLSACWDPARVASNLKSLFSQMLLIACLAWMVLQLLFGDKQPLRLAVHFNGLPE